MKTCGKCSYYKVLSKETYGRLYCCICIKSKFNGQISMHYVRNRKSCRYYRKRKKADRLTRFSLVCDKVRKPFQKERLWNWADLQEEPEEYWDYLD